MGEMVVCLTAFALRESSASWSGGCPQRRERGKVKVKFCPTGEQGGSGSRKDGRVKAGWLPSLPQQEPKTCYLFGC